MNNQVQQFFGQATKWREEFNLLREIVTENKLLQEAYKWMHPCYALEGKQKGYLIYFNQAKQSKTRLARIEKYYQQILEGRGRD